MCRGAVVINNCQHDDGSRIERMNSDSWSVRTGSNTANGSCGSGGQMVHRPSPVTSIDDGGDGPLSDGENGGGVTDARRRRTTPLFEIGLRIERTSTTPAALRSCFCRSS